MMFFFFQAEDGIRDIGVTGVQTCALPICLEAEPLEEGVVPVQRRPPLLVVVGDVLGRAVAPGTSDQLCTAGALVHGRDGNRALRHPGSTQGTAASTSPSSERSERTGLRRVASTQP